MIDTVYHLVVNNNEEGGGGGLINFLPLKREGLFERGAKYGIYGNFKKRCYYSLTSLVLVPKTYRHNGVHN